MGWDSIDSSWVAERWLWCVFLKDGFSSPEKDLVRTIWGVNLDMVFFLPIWVIFSDIFRIEIVESWMLLSSRKLLPCQSLSWWLAFGFFWEKKRLRDLNFEDVLKFHPGMLFWWNFSQDDLILCWILIRQICLRMKYLTLPVHFVVLTIETQLLHPEPAPNGIRRVN